MNITSDTNIKTSCGNKIGDVGTNPGGTKAVVVTDRVAVTGVTPSAGVTVAGLMVQVASAGAPEQASETGWLNPPTGVIVTVAEPLEPAVTVKVD
jgi:hypothetical protein